LVTSVAALLGLVLPVGTYLGFRRQARLQLAGKVETAIGEHIDTLISVRAQSLRYGDDASGRLRSPEWQQEIERFLDSQVSAALSPGELRRLAQRRAHFAAVVAERVAASVARLPVYQ
jgi:hypothetical protein